MNIYKEYIMIQRRKFLTLSSITALHVLTGCGGGSNSNHRGSGNGNGGMGGGQGGNTSTNNPASSTTSLPIPPLLIPRDAGGVKHYDLTIQASQHTFFDGVATNTYGINGSYLGPTLLVENGSRISLNYRNTLGEPVSMHAHGMHAPANMDGSAHQTIAASASWSAQYTVKQKANTSWYHPHTMDNTAPQVYKGLAGLMIVEDTQSRSLNLPKRYGEDDIPLVLQDRVFNNGQINYAPSRMSIMRGYTGDTFIVNGAINPTFNAEAKEIRFRLLNGSNSSVYTLAFSDRRSFKQIASDSAFLEAPVTLTSVRLSPGERAEIVVDFSNNIGQSVVLKELNNNKSFLTINVNQDPSTITSVPSKLTTFEKFNPSSAVRTRNFELGGHMGALTINGKSMDKARIDEVVPLNDIEIWNVSNTMGVNHNFHIHATHFRLLSRNGNTSAVSANERGLKDVVYIPPHESVSFIVKMIDYTDTTVPYMYHCHFLEHEDNGMMGQFTVV